MIVVTGATGKLGSAIVRSLLGRSLGSKVVASARSPEEASELSALGVEIRQGDFAKPETLKSAFAGAGQVLLVSSNAAAYGEDPVAQHRAAIQAAKAAGARRVLYTSHVGASETSLFAPMLTHAATERMLAESGLAWTSLRNGFYASSALGFIGNGLKSGTISAPLDGKVAWTTHADLAEAAAAILASEGSFDGPTVLTGGEALDMDDLARIASEVLRREIRRVVVPDEDFEADLVVRHVPLPLVRITLGFYAASRNREFARVDGTLASLIGRKPQSMRDVFGQL
ncbi:MAG TPA: NAD(P)H-binding protein [Polyangiaceae bacterium]|nr:NAD(P)H-binding protein [Polyangiaceae bacterium]